MGVTVGKTNTRPLQRFIRFPKADKPLEGGQALTSAFPENLLLFSTSSSISPFYDSLKIHLACRLKLIAKRCHFHEQPHLRLSKKQDIVQAATLLFADINAVIFLKDNALCLQEKKPSAPF